MVKTINENTILEIILSNQHITTKQLRLQYNIAFERAWQLMSLVSWHNVLVEDGMGIKIVRKIINKVKKEYSDLEIIKKN